MNALNIAHHDANASRCHNSVRRVKPPPYADLPGMRFKSGGRSRRIRQEVYPRRRARWLRCGKLAAPLIGTNLKSRNSVYSARSGAETRHPQRGGSRIGRRCSIGRAGPRPGRRAIRAVRRRQIPCRGGSLGRPAGRSLGIPFAARWLACVDRRRKRSRLLERFGVGNRPRSGRPVRHGCGQWRGLAAVARSTAPGKPAPSDLYDASLFSPLSTFVSV